MFDEMGHVMAVPVPVGDGIVAAFGDDHWPPPFGEEEEGETRRHQRILDPPTAE